MRNLLAFIGGIVVTFLGMGWYLDWYKLSREPGTTPGSSRLQIDINNEMIRADVSSGVQRGKEILGNALEKKSDSGAAPGPEAAANPAAPTATVTTPPPAPNGAIINVTLPPLLPPASQQRSGGN
jgi:hypothetical protein